MESDGDVDEGAARGAIEGEPVDEIGEAARKDPDAGQPGLRRVADGDRVVVLVDADPDAEVAKPVAAHAVVVAGRIAVGAVDTCRELPRVGQLDAVELGIAVGARARASGNERIGPTRRQGGKAEKKNPR